eukprot:3814608-Prorocentrum_lima.AAC.1
MRYGSQPDVASPNSNEPRKRPRYSSYSSSEPSLQPNMFMVGDLGLPRSLLELPPTNLVNVVYYS